MENKGPIGVIGAMTVEVKGLIAQMENDRTQETAGLVFHRGLLGGVDCVVAKCGAGKVNSAVCAQVMITQYAPRLVINVGVAGGMDVGIGDLVVASQCVQHDFDTAPLGEPQSQLTICRGEGEESFVMLNSDQAASALLLEEARQIYGGAHLGVIAPGGQFGAKAVEMEGASIAQACYMNSVPFAILRAVSDNANDDSPADFPAFVQACAEKSARLLAKALPRL